MKLFIESHNPAWLEEFVRVKKDLENILSGVIYTDIIHIGSTSIPGLIAKPVLDIAIIVKAENVGSASDALVNAGYGARGELGSK